MPPEADNRGASALQWLLVGLRRRLNSYHAGLDTSSYLLRPLPYGDPPQNW
ncbi:hypothetical protein [Prochlorococcus marinus]|uniref:hypothetical protein n=1 Tax=Prochlorococcus marinus TaxID=1219 RepID=UPI000B18E336|nr:hypothetical protein [Prochlorococcus marinus]